MVNEGILEGLKVGLSKGESLKQAMMSFYNAGYKKEEIEEAARALQTQRLGQPMQVQPKKAQPVPRAKLKSPKTVIQPRLKEKVPLQRVSSYGEKPKKQRKKPIKPIQKVSSYKQKPAKPKGKALVIILMFTLFILIGVLVTVFFFKEELVELFNSLF